MAGRRAVANTLIERQSAFSEPLRANITETLSVTTFSEQGEKEDQHDSQEHRPFLQCDVGCGPT